ncbi:MAG TPA: response regulator transcription factor [Virgibacillus sp.]|nr:response regulator transcription factor [Virgibacillus sp.]
MISILLVDDHAIVRAGIKLLINSEPDMNVLYEAENGEEAVTKALTECPDVVIMDLNMPRKNGLIATQQIKEANSDIKVIVLTMHEEREYISRALQAGASGYLLKSHQAGDLIKAIRTVHRGEAFLDPDATKVLIQDYVNISNAMDQQSQKLTGREQEVLSYLAKGYTNREVAELLYVSIKTIESHRSKIMEKLNIKTRHELVKYAIKEGFLDFVY